MATKITLQSIQDTYCNLQFNEHNYSIGGGLVEEKLASRRHEEALNDNGKLTLGEATQLFKRATGLDTETVREVIKYAVPNMEWHHAGKLPKAYGGKMKKTYFLNSLEICDIASNWDTYLERLNLSKIAFQNEEQKKKDLEARRLDYLQKYAKKVERVIRRPKYFFLTKREMQGKYGWFDSAGKSYNLTEYYSGWEFENEETYKEFLNIQ